MTLVFSATLDARGVALDLEVAIVATLESRIQRIVQFSRQHLLEFSLHETLILVGVECRDDGMGPCTLRITARDAKLVPCGIRVRSWRLLSCVLAQHEYQSTMRGRRPT